MTKYEVRRWGAGLVVFLLVLLGFGVFGDRSVTAVQGDQLGPESEETRADYLDRAAASLAEADDAAYALVSFAYPLPPAEAAAAVDGVARVDAMIVGSASAVPLPEPTAGRTRADVFFAEFERINAGLLQGNGGVSVPETLTAVVVHDSGDVLRDIAGRRGVAAVEVAPADAAWGSFGIRPLAALES